MKNKKAEFSVGLIMSLIIGIVVVFIVFNTFIKDIFVGDIIASAGGRSEEISIDCDQDSVTGIPDQCPCVAATTELESGKSCGPPDPLAKQRCPKLCR